MNELKLCKWCGIKLKIEQFNFCNLNCQTEYINFTAIKIKPKLTKCICPSCGLKYNRKIIWIGNSIPRIFCDICINHEYIEDIDNDEYLLH